MDAYEHNAYFRVSTTVCCVKEPRKKKAKSFRSRTFLEGDSQENYGANCGQVATHLEMVASSPKKRAESELLLCYLLSNTIPFGSKKGSANQSSTIFLPSSMALTNQVCSF